MERRAEPQPKAAALPKIELHCYGLGRFQENCGREFRTGLKARNKIAQGEALGQCAKRTFAL